MNARLIAASVLRLSPKALSASDAEGVMPVGASPRTPPANYREFLDSLVLPDDPGPFHFTYHIGELCSAICRQTPELRHINMQRVLVTFSRCRNQHPWGLQAKLVPLRFRGGERMLVRQGRPYQVQQFFVGEQEQWYVLTFFLPRFLNQTFDEKLITLFHELYHIHPTIAGDIRRLPGMRPLHSASQRQYDAAMAALARQYLSGRPPRRLHDFLYLNYEELRRRFGDVVGVSLPAPKLILQRHA